MKDATYDADWLVYHSQRSLERMLPRITNRLGVGTDAAHWATFERRLGMHFPRLFQLLFALYGHQYDFFYHLEAILTTAAQFWLARPADLMALDALRETESNWFQSNQMLGGVCYVDLFCWRLRYLSKNRPKRAEINGAHAAAAFNEGGFLLSGGRASSRLELGTKVFELLHADRVQ
jgi:amylosucrase